MAVKDRSLRQVNLVHARLGFAQIGQLVNLPPLVHQEASSRRDIAISKENVSALKPALAQGELFHATSNLMKNQVVAVSPTGYVLIIQDVLITAEQEHAQTNRVVRKIYQMEFIVTKQALIHRQMFQPLTTSKASWHLLQTQFIIY